MEFTPIVRFAVMSDVHYQEKDSFQRERFKSAMEFVYNYSENEEYKNLDALYVVGDFTDLGKTEQFEMFAEDCKAYVKDSTKLVPIIGGHELQFVPDANVALQDFKRVFDMDYDRHEVINGYHFISLSTIKDKGPWSDSFDITKREFLKTELEKARKDGGNKPIFVFQHPGQVDTISGGFYGNSEIHSILSQYPQVIDFSGHSHCPVNDPREIHQCNYTSVSTGTLYYISLGIFKKYTNARFDEYAYTDKEKPHMIKGCAHMLIVEVDGKGTVRIRKVDVVAGDFFENDYYIEDAYDISKHKYTQQRAKTASTPYFDIEAKVSIVRSENNIKVEFPGAHCENERVFGYNVRIKSGDTVIAQKGIVSDFMRLHQQDMYSTTFENVCDDDISAEVYAFGFWDNYSKPIKSK
ncbi:MAG: metallophosphoesterase [Clostridia bacterium]|nr:metallophosphoesterase [Clostridia bacterium]